MSESKKPPPTPRGVPIVRFQEKQSTRAHRDHRRPSEGDGEPEPFEDEEFTDRYEGEELAALRATRPDEIRLARLEKNQDEIRGEVGGLRTEISGVKVAVADMGGQFKIIPQLVTTMQGAIDALQQTQHMTFTAKLDVDKAQALGAVQVNTAQQLGEVEVKKVKWGLVVKAAAIVGSIITALGAAFAAGRC